MMKKEHLNIYFFMATMVVYFLIFLLALYNYSKNIPTLNIGLGQTMINLLIMGLCFFGIIKTLFIIKNY